MRICLVADIHGNQFALAAALAAMKAEGADRYLFLGDICGYYYGQIEALEMLCQLPGLQGVKGNHDQTFLDVIQGRDSGGEYRRNYGCSLDMLVEQAPPAFHVWLGGLSESWLDPNGFFICYHGSPNNPMQGYVYPDSELPTLPEQMNVDFCFSGHTHYRMVREKDGVLFVNPGSLGQPRDGLPSSYCVVDVSTREVFFRDVYWNRNLMRAEIAGMGEEGMYHETILQRSV